MTGLCSSRFVMCFQKKMTMTGLRVGVYNVEEGRLLISLGKIDYADMRK